ncbi:MAG: polysaccharide biosynthesis C-terminal domain-containing protein [Bacteroidota bacterium]|nr:polysaccharide biosynthesis C-terminal domain-containing protein [Bacteroidota bacterium]
MPVAKVLYKSLFWKTFQFASSFLVSILFARVLRSAVSAEFYSLSYLLALAVSFFTLGLDISFNYYIPRRELPPATANRIILIIIAGALLLGLPLVWLMYSSAIYPHIGARMFLLFSALTITGGLFSALSGTLFTAHGRNHVPAQIAFLANLLVLGGGLASVVLFPGAKAIDALFLLYFVSSFLQGAVLFFLSLRLYGRRSRERPAPVAPNAPPETPTGSAIPLKAILRFSFAAFVTNLIFYVGSRMCLYLIPYWAPRPDQGNFFQAFKIVEYVGIAASFIYYPVIALVAGDEAGNMQRRVLLLVRLSNTIVLILAMGIAAVGWWALPFVFGRSFDRMYAILLACIPGLFAIASSTFFTAYFFGRGRLRINLISACIQLAVVLILFFLLIRSWGVIGAAAAFSMAGLTSFVYDCLAFKRVAGCRPRDLLFVRRSDLITLSSSFGLS